MTRGKLLIAVGMVAAVAIAVCVALVISKRPSDCDTVRSMIAHNNAFNEHVESATSSGIQTTNEEVRDWASQLHHLAEQVRDPALAEPAGNLANLADQAVAFSERFLADEAAADHTSPPPSYIRDYSQLGKDFDTTLATLDQKCPA